MLNLYTTDKYCDINLLFQVRMIGNKPWDKNLLHSYISYTFYMWLINLCKKNPIFLFSISEELGNYEYWYLHESFEVSPKKEQQCINGNIILPDNDVVYQ